MAKKKRISWQFREYETREFAQHLEDMAAKGWILKNISLVTGSLVFEQGEPRSWRFNVVVLPGSSAFENGDREEARQFRKSCGEAGWKFLYGNSFWQIFYTEDLNQPPIETNPELQLENQRSVSLSWGRWFSAVILLGLAVWDVMLSLRDPVSTLASWRSLVIIAVVLNIFLQPFCHLVSCLIWYRKARRSLKRSGELPERNLHHVRRRSRLSVIWKLALLLLLFWGCQYSMTENVYLIVRAVVMVTICSLVLLWVQGQGGDRRDALFGYTVGAATIGFVALMSLDGIWSRIFPAEPETEPYQSVVECPVTLEQLGYQAEKEGYLDSKRSALGEYQAEDGRRRDEDGTEESLYMKYYSSPISWAVRRTAENYRVDRGNVWNVTELPKRQENGISVVGYHYHPEYNEDESFINEKLQDWEAYVISDEHRLLFLEFSDVPDPVLLETAVEAFQNPPGK